MTLHTDQRARVSAMLKGRRSFLERFIQACEAARAPSTTHAPIIEQIEQWAGALESFDFSCRGQRQPEIITGIIEQMRQVAADLERGE
jgi:hypothetical protein